MIRRLLLLAGAAVLVGAASSVFLLGGPAPTARTLPIPARDGVPAHAVRLLTWKPRGRPAAQLFYEPGWGGAADENSRLAAALAGEGYAVTAVDYAAEQPAAFAPVMTRLQAPLDLSSMDALARTIQQGDWRATMMAGDAAYVLQTQDPEGDSLKAGIFGWSFGGAVALEACRQEPRFAACLNMDGWMFGPAADHPSAQPFMVVSGDSYTDHAEPYHTPVQALDEWDLVRLRSRLATMGGRYVQVLGAVHDDFVGGRAVRGPLLRLISGFFGESLRGVPTPVLAAGKPLPGVVVTAFPRPADTPG